MPLSKAPRPLGPHSRRRRERGLGASSSSSPRTSGTRGHSSRTRAPFGCFCEWLEDCGVQDLAQVNPVVAGYVEKLGEAYSKPTVKQHLAAIRMLFDYLVTGGVLPFNPSVRGPEHTVRRG
jgi:hypothetical protein